MRNRWVAACNRGYFSVMHFVVRHLSPVGLGPVWGHDSFPWLAHVEARHAEIVAEMQAYLASGRTMLDKEELLPGQTSQFGAERWEMLHLMSYGERLEHLIAHFPATMAAVAAVPHACSVMFSRLPPERRTIPRHRDAKSGTLRLHLGLQVPTSGACYIGVGDQTAHWQEGRAFVIDASAPHHVLKEAHEQRVILIVDFVRPMANWLRWLSYRQFIKHVSFDPLRSAYRAGEPRP